MSELVPLCRRLWTEERVAFQGRFYPTQDTTLEPKPCQPGGIPMLLACHHGTGSQAQYRRAGRHADGVIGITDAPSEYAQVLGQVRDEARQAGRDPSSLRTVFYMTVNLNADPQAAFREADRFLREYYGLNIWKDRWGPFGPPQEVARRILEYISAGSQEVIVRFASLDPQGQLAAFLDHVLPLVRKGSP